MSGTVKNKIFIWYFAAILSICFEMNAYAKQNFYHGKEFKRPAFSWQRKDTEHFVVRYKDRYFDPERVLKMLSEKFGIQPVISGIKIRLFIGEPLSYTIVGAKTIYAHDEKALIHELTHVLFIQLNRNAPMSIAEGVAVYAETQGQVPVFKVGVEEIIAAEKDSSQVYRTRAARAVYGGHGKSGMEKQLYSKGFCFVNNIISKKGMGAFKEFYQKCSDVRNIQKAWDQVYGE